MVIYGWQSTHIKTIQSNNVTCPSCGEKGGIINSFYGKYIHIFWIPTISIGRTGACQCTKCSDVFKPKKMPEEMKREYSIAKSEAKIPLWHFSGAGVILLLILFFSISNNAEAKYNAEYIANPLAGDVYEYEDSPNNFSTIKVIEVREDSLVFVHSNYAFTTKRGIETIDVDSCYSDTLYIMSKNELSEMYDSGSIFDVKRN